MSDRTQLPGDPSYPPGVTGTEPQITGDHDGERAAEKFNALAEEHVGPLSLDGIRAAGENVFEVYAEDQADHFIEMAADVQQAIEGEALGLHKAGAAIVNAFIAKHREATFSNGFALGAAFVAGAAATVRVGADDSENNDSYRGSGLALNCTIFGDDFGNVILMIAQEHGEPGERPGWPNRGALIRGGTDRVLNWMPKIGAKYDGIVLQFSANNGRSWRTVAENLQPGKPVTWAVPEVNSNICRLRIVGLLPPDRKIMLANSTSFAVHTASPKIFIGPKEILPEPD